MINEKGATVYLKKKAVELEWERKLFHDLQKKGDNVISQIFDKPPPPILGPHPIPVRICCRSYGLKDSIINSGCKRFHFLTKQRGILKLIRISSSASMKIRQKRLFSWIVREKRSIRTASLAVPAKHNPATVETQDCVHPESERGYGRRICDQMTATPSELKPGFKKMKQHWYVWSYSGPIPHPGAENWRRLVKHMYKWLVH